MAVTVPAPISRHLLVYVAVAIAAMALVASVLIGMAVADSGSSTDLPRTSGVVQQELPTRFSEGRPSSASTTGHPADPARYGSPDAAEEWNR